MFQSRAEPAYSPLKPAHGSFYSAEGPVNFGVWLDDPAFRQVWNLWIQVHLRYETPHARLWSR